MSNPPLRIGLGASTLALGRLKEPNFPSGRATADAQHYTRMLTTAVGAEQVDVFVPVRHRTRFMTWLIQNDLLAHITRHSAGPTPPGLLPANIISYYPQAGDANARAVERGLSIYVDSDLAALSAFTHVARRLAFRPDLRSCGRNPQLGPPLPTIHGDWSNLYAQLTALATTPTRR
jgi:hypothetical protein